MSKSQFGILATFLAIYVVTILLVGEPIWLLPGLILAALVIGWFTINRAGTERIANRHGGDAERALSDEEEPIPSAHLITDDDRPLGDTPEAHDEINPRDLPPDNPARHEAERRVGEEGGETRGNV